MPILSALRRWKYEDCEMSSMPNVPPCPVSADTLASSDELSFLLPWLLPVLFHGQFEKSYMKSLET